MRPDEGNDGRASTGPSRGDGDAGPNGERPRRTVATAGEGEAARSWRIVARLFDGATRGEGIEALPPLLDDLSSRLPPERLEAEYVRLFVNALPEVPCPPYASVELEGVLHGKVTGSVRELYRRWGVETNRVPDHFAVEAAFLAGLLAAAPEDGAAARDLAWLARHLRSWAPTFLRRVETHDRTGFWAGAARWARELVDGLEAG